MKKIVIDGRMYQQSGIGRYIRNLINQLQRLDKDNEYFILLLDKNFEPDMYQSNFKKVLANFGWYGISEQFTLPKLLKEIKPNLVHFPHFNVPIFYKDKFVVTIHDLIHQHFQMKRATTNDPVTYQIKQFGYDLVFKNAINKSVKILVPSKFVKDQLVKGWKVDNKKIVITHEAVDDKIFTIANKMSQERIDGVMEKFNIRVPYIFYVGNAHPHKNVEGLIQAFLKLKERYPKLALVLSGQDHYFWQRIKREYQYDGIIYTGYVSDEMLVALYKNASCFVMPSFEEGFGIPLLEAMACGCPVVSSNAGALGEVGGTACIYFDPAKPDDMGDQIDRVLNNVDLRNELIRKGQKRYKQFSWEKLTKQTLEVYKQCA